MNSSAKYVLAGLFVTWLGMTGCGAAGTGSSTAASSTGTPSSVDADLSKVDATSKASASESLPPPSQGLSVSKAFGAASGDDSMAGCQARQLVDEGIRMSKGISVFQCYMRQTQDNFPNFTCTGSEFAAYTFIFGAGKAGLKNAGISMEIRCKTVGGTQTVHVCEGNKQNEAFVLTTDSAARKITFSMKHHFTSASEGSEGQDFCDTNGDSSVSDAERASCRSGGSFDEWGDMSGNIIFDAAATGVVDSLNEFDSAGIAGKFNGNFGVGSMDFTYDEDGSPSGGLVNTALGCFQFSFGSGDSGTGCIYAELNSAEGSAKYSVNGSMPCLPGLPSHLSGCHCPIARSEKCDPSTEFAKAACRVASPPASCYCVQAASGSSCSFDEGDTEHFTISLSGGKPKFAIASTSIFASNVTAKTLPTAPATLTKSFGSEAWDCQASSSTKIAVDNEDVIYATCFAKEKEAFESSDRDSCYQDRGEDNLTEGKAAQASLGLTPPE